MTNSSPIEEAPPATALKPLIRIKPIGHIIGAVAWTIAVTKIFVFDVDRYLFDISWPDGKWLLDYKLVLYFAVAGLLILIFGTARFLLLAGFVALYPLVLLLWTLPSLIFRKQSWNFALATLFATTLTFSAINFAMFKADAKQFEISNSTFFSFFYYSFNNLLFNSIKEISPVGALAQSVAMLQNLLALVLIALFASLLITVRSERYAKEIDELASTIEEGGKELEVYVRNEYKMQTIDQAITELERLQAGIIKLLIWLTKNIRN